jgi:hypothetical protein
LYIIKTTVRGALAATGFSLALLGLASVGLSSPSGSVADNEQIFGGAASGDCLLAAGVAAVPTVGVTPPVTSTSVTISLGTDSINGSQFVSSPFTPTSTLVGAANLDLEANNADLNILDTSLGQGDTIAIQANAALNGLVISNGLATDVPEPVCAGIAICGLAAFGMRRRRGSSAVS